MNARKSTGPKTEEGKSVARLNALKHGLRSQLFGDAIDGGDDDDAGYKDLLDELIDHYQPQNPVEELLVRRIALLDWRLHRISVAERRSMQSAPGVSHSLPPAGAMERILKYERTMDRELHRAIQQLEKMRVNLKKSTNEPEIELNLSVTNEPEIERETYAQTNLGEHIRS